MIALDTREQQIEEIVDVIVEADKTSNSPTVFTVWHHYAEALLDAGYVKPDYEYRIMRRWKNEENFHELGPWYSNLAQAQEVFKRNVDVNIHHKTGTEFKLVKRIAHGPVVDA